MLPGRRQRGIEGGGDQHLDHRLARPAHARAHRDRRAPGSRQAGPDDDARAVVILQVLAGPAREVGSSDSATFMRKTPGAGFDPDKAPARAPDRRACRAAGRGTTASAEHWPRRRAPVISSPDCRRTPAAPAVLRDQGGDRCIGADVGHPLLRPPATIACVIAPMPPMAWPHTPVLPFTSPKRGAAARRPCPALKGTGIGADDAVEGQGALHDLALEPLGKKVRRALGEEIDKQALVVERKASSRRPSLPPAISSRMPPPALGGRFRARSRRSDAARPAPHRRQAAARHPPGKRGHGALAACRGRAASADSVAHPPARSWPPAARRSSGHARRDRGP